MKAIALSRKERRYTPTELEGESPRPVFKIKSMPRRAYLQVLSDKNVSIPKAALDDAKDGKELTPESLASDDMSGIWKTLLSSYDTNIEILKKYLLDWENMKDETGDDFEFSVDNMEYLPEDLMADLVREITGGVKEEDEKNSGKESQSLNGSESQTTQENGTANSAEVRS